MEFGVIVAARTGSRRLPAKALLTFANMPMIIFLIRRLRKSQVAKKIIFATTTLSEDDKLASLVAAENIPVFRGSAEDVVARYVDTANAFNIGYVVRVTGDCPFVDAETLDYCLDKCLKLKDFDLATTKSYFPVGIDYEIYKSSVMAQLHAGKVLSKDDREHLTEYLYDHRDKFNVEAIKPLNKWIFKEKKFTVDTISDYNFANSIALSFPDIYFSLDKLIERARQ